MRTGYRFIAHCKALACKAVSAQKLFKVSCTLLFIGMGSAFAYTFSGKRKGKIAKRTFQGVFILCIALVVAKGLLPSILIQDNLKIILLLLPIALSGATFHGWGDRKKL